MSDIVKGIAPHFESYASMLSCLELDRIDTTQEILAQHKDWKQWSTVSPAFSDSDNLHLPTVSSSLINMLYLVCFICTKNIYIYKEDFSAFSFSFTGGCVADYFLQIFKLDCLLALGSYQQRGKCSLIKAKN